MRLDPALWQRRAGLPALLAALEADGDATRLVGGAVRDTLLGLPVSDVDLATRLPPADSRARIAAAGFKAVPTGLAHGTVTAVLPSGTVEVTTLRRDVSTDGRRATVAFTDDWREDAARRDFTINALFARPADGVVVDHFDGEADLAARRVRFIGDPYRRIAEDHLRILRFFRFHARFGADEPDNASLDACVRRAGDLNVLSVERVRDEVLKLLVAVRAVEVVTLMAERGVLAAVGMLPSIEQADVARLARLVAAETAAEVAPDPIRRLAALLGSTGRHESEAVARRLKLSNAERVRLSLDADASLSGSSAEALVYRSGPDVAVDRLLLADRVGDAIRMRTWRKPDFGLTGGALIRLGLAPGPLVAETLRAVERQWIDEGFPPETRAREIAAGAVAQALDRQ